MEEMITILAVGAPYDFKSDSGQQVSGCSVWYIPNTDFNPTSEVDEAGNVGVLGYLPRKETFPKEFHQRAMSVGVPCQAKAHFRMAVRNGQSVLKIDGCDFVKSSK